MLNLDLGEQLKILFVAILASMVVVAIGLRAQPNASSFGQSIGYTFAIAPDK